MKRALLIAVILLVAPWPSSAQTAAAAPPVVAVPSAAEMEQFLRDGKIVKKKESSKGVTDAFRVTLSHGPLTHDAQVQNVDIEKAFFQVDPKHTEVGFKDSYRYNIAAYRLATMLGLDNVPMSVERIVDGKPSAVTWWLDGVMDDGDRQKKKIANSNPLRAADYYSVMYVFDELIQNRDRNRGNIMWTPDSRMWLIDHTRAFRLGRDLRSPENLTRVERTLFEKMRALDRQAFADAIGRTLTKDEIEALFIRRDRLVQHFELKIASLGEEKVVYTIR
jgi:hypothetical protein